METQQTQQNRESHHAQSRDAGQERLASGLGWFSIGLGLAEVLAPGLVGGAIGLKDRSGNRTLLRIYGIREIAAGIGILSQQRPAGWLWGRVAGDLVDLTSLGSALTSGGTNRTRAGVATAAVLGVTALDVLCAQQMTRASSNGQSESNDRESNTQGPIRVTKTIIVGRSPEEVYRFWRDFTQLPAFMSHLDSVEVTGDNRSHWKAKLAGGKTVEWDAEMVDDQPNSRIAWRSLPGADVHNAGSVSFERATGDRGTLVRLEMQYGAPSAITAALAKLFHAVPEQQIENDLRAFKQVLETGEVAKSEASIHPGMHPARPSARAATA